MLIPDELVLHIISGFSRSDLAKVSRASTQFHCVSNPLLYRHVTTRNPHDVVDLLLKETKLATYVVSLRIEQPLEGGALRGLLARLPNLVRLYLYSASSPESIFGTICGYPQLTRLELDAPILGSPDKTIKCRSLDNITDLTISMEYLYGNLPMDMITPFLPAKPEKFRVRTVSDKWTAILTHLEFIVEKPHIYLEKLRLIEIHDKPWYMFTKKSYGQRYTRLVSMGRTKNIEVQIRAPQDCRMSPKSSLGLSFQKETIEEEGESSIIYQLAEQLLDL